MKPNWAEYGLEAFGLGLFMVSACGFGIVLFHPDSWAVTMIPEPLPRRALMGLAMGLTAALNNYAPWGRRSGAHLNPAVTLTFWTLGKMAPKDLVGYVVAQFLGGIAGTAIAVWLWGDRLAAAGVNFVVTVPGPAGVAAAFVAEVAITFGLMAVVLTMLSQPRWSRYAGLAGPALVVLYIAFETPISGMSMNPARSLGSAVFAQEFTSLWIYFLAPPLGMLAAALLSRRWVADKHCAKLVHDHKYRCLFCEWADRQRRG